MGAGRILVVDDEPAVRLFSRRVLEGAGYQVRDAANGQLAAETLMSEAFDAILIDLRMPSGSGDTLIQWILSHYPLMGSRILIVTGDPAPKAWLTFVNTINIPVLRKPFTAEQLLERLGDVLPPPDDGAPASSSQ